jgi:hypothetical protein
MQVDEIVTFKGIECRSNFPLVIGVQIARCTGNYNDFETGVDPDSPNQVNR